MSTNLYVTRDNLTDLERTKYASTDSGKLLLKLLDGHPLPFDGNVPRTQIALLVYSDLLPSPERLSKQMGGLNGAGNHGRVEVDWRNQALIQGVLITQTRFAAAPPPSTPATVWAACDPLFLNIVKRHDEREAVELTRRLPPKFQWVCLADRGKMPFPYRYVAGRE